MLGAPQAPQCLAQKVSQGSVNRPVALAPTRTRRRQLHTNEHLLESIATQGLNTPSRPGSRGDLLVACSGRAGYSWSGVNENLTATHHQPPNPQRDLSFPRQQGPTDLNGGQPLANVSFHLKYKTSYGQSVKVLGNHAKLGSWNLANSLEMRWTSGDVWVAEAQLPAGAVYEYKYVLVDYNTKQPLEWQHGSNAVLAVVVGETDVDVFDNWGNNPGSSVQVENESMTREAKLQKWSQEMMGYWKEARRAQLELANKSSETQVLKNEVAQLKMELSMEKQQRMEVEAQLMEARIENASLRSQLVQKTQEVNTTLAEVLKLLDRELDEEGTDSGSDLYGDGLGAQLQALSEQHHTQQQQQEDQGQEVYHHNGNGHGQGFGGLAAGWAPVSLEWARNGKH